MLIKPTTRGGSDRSGFSLLEVLIASAIFLISIAVLVQLLNLTGERALEVQQLSRASQLSQSKLAEVISGAVSLSSQSGDFDEDPDWHWQVQAEQDSSITGLWRVQVKVSRDMGDGNTIESTVNQMVLDPSLRGSTADATTGGTPSTTTKTGP
jgi:prepilin-type N-terminal cleavage/methylation domain-containing protein